jgi:Uma2 family endonuclease
MPTYRAPPDNRRLSVEEFQRLPDEEGRMELIAGAVVREPPPGAEHGYVGLKLLAALLQYVEEHDLGLVVSMDTGFVLADEPATVRAPDLAFISKERLPADGIPTGYWRLSPDLAVEIVSPADRMDAVQGKMLEYLDVGVREVWVIHPRSRSVTVSRSSTDVRVLTDDDTLDGGPVVPGFRIALSSLFP